MDTNSLLLHETEGSGPDVLLVHGLLTQSAVWRPVVERLSGRYRVTWCGLPDRRGLPRTVDDEPDSVREVLHLMETLDLSEAHLVGHGAGCSTISGVAVREPGRALSIAMVDPLLRRTGPTLTGPADHLKFLLNWLEPGIRNTMYRPRTVRFLRRVVEEQTFAMMAEQPGSTPPVAETAVRRNLMVLQQVPCRIIAVVGDQREAEGRDLLRQVIDQIPDGRIIEVPEAGADCLIQAPRAVARILDEFLSEHGAPGHR